MYPAYHAEIQHHVFDPKGDIRAPVVPNHLRRKFKQETPYKVLLTDITYIFYGNGKRAYLSTIIDGSTNEVLAHQLSENIKLDIVLDTLKKLRKNRRVRLPKDAFIHSDQGGHYTSLTYQKQVKRMKLSQSMSLRGNYWNNVVQEYLFGHFKDIIELDQCTTFEYLCSEVRRTIDYHNHHRYQSLPMEHEKDDTRTIQDE